MRELVYLVGQISPKYPITYEWREDVIEHFIGMDRRIGFIDPCNNDMNKKVLESGEYAVKKHSREPGLDLIVPKDRSYVRRSSIGLVNMNQYDPDKPLLGSFFELAWYFDSPEKAVVGFADDMDDYLVQHPFVQQAVTIWCENVEEACFNIEKYFI